MPGTLRPDDWLACPLDGAALFEAEGGLQCSGGHRFDRAREGYFNLLLNQHKSSSDPGDSKDMVRARSDVLNSGLFRPLADRLFTIVHDLASAQPGKACHIVDAGCGDGYYLDRLCQDASAAALDFRYAGIDISKSAIQAAAKRGDGCTWLVANNRYPPFMARSTDIILCLFGFPVFDAFRQIQGPDGCVVMVDPGPDHLIELRTIIYPDVRQSPPPTWDEALAAGYRLESSQQLTFTGSLDTPTRIENVLKMTPHYFRMPPSGREKLKDVAQISVTIDLSLRAFRAGG